MSSISHSSSPVRADYLEKVTGRAEFISDIVVPGMLHGKILRSPIPHGRIVSIDISAALALPGVETVFTGADVDGFDAHWGPSIKDRPVIAIDRVRYVGEPVAVVAALDERTAYDALDLIEVEYEDLPFVTDEMAALADDAPILHEAPEPLKDFYFKGQAKTIPSTNVFQDYKYEVGNVDEAFAAADRVFEDTFTFPMVFHYAMEPHCAIASFHDDGTLTVWSCGQAPTMVQKVLAGMFRMPLSSIRIITPYVGGGFGGKASVKIDPLVAAVAWKAKRPVRICLSISETMLTCRRLSASITVKTGVTASGEILGKAVKVVMNGGAYADTGPAVAVKAANRSIGPYHIPNLRLESLAVYTNTVPGAAFRSIGGPQAVWATESQMDIIADELGIDPAELRYRNMLKVGERVRPDLRGIDVDMATALGLASQTMNRIEDGHPDNRLARGAAVGASDPGIMAVSSAILRLKIDGSILVLSNSVEIGQGVREVLALMAAELLKQPREAVTVMQPDTAHAPYDWGTGASRSSLMMGLALQDAAKDILSQLADMASDCFGVAADSVELRPGGVASGERFWSFADVLHAAYGVDSGEIVGIGRVTPRSRGGTLAEAPLFWETAAAMCGIDVDEDTGAIKLRNYVSVADVGHVLNRVAAEGQDEGAAIQGLGHALYEELIYDDGQPVNATMIDYHVPTIDEAPETFSTVLVESGTGPGLNGARGMGEGAILPVAPAIANALAARYRIRIRDLPITPEKVWRALRDRKAR
ncbi:MAG: xanthine dehydrogenase family protein molybdopterin-binding subunit [Xanthobacteraceae bacterium]